VVSTNNAGLRSDRPLGAKAAGAVRILCLGDSVTFGYRVPVAFPGAPDSYNRNEAPYPTLIERWLRRANAGRAIEVVNMAVPGYSSRQALAWLRRDIGRVEPDVVTICVGWNDVSAREQPDHAVLQMDVGHVLARRVVGSSQLLMHASLAAGRLGRRLAKDNAGAELVPRATASEFAANVIAATQVARAHGAQVVVIAPVFGGVRTQSPDRNRMTTYRATLRRAAEREGLGFLEVTELTEAAFPKNAAYFPIEAIHPGFEGHRLLAQALLRLLEERGTLASLGLLAPQAEMRESP
jgi:lysophospholipase L1-like esterase